MNPERQQKIDEISKLGPCWREIWLGLLDTNHCSVYAEDNWYIAEYKQTLKSTCEDFWSEEIEGANARGWNWSGDTGVYVTKITGPTTIQQAAIDWILRTGHFEFYAPQRHMDDPDDIDVADASISTQPMTWEEFWRFSVKGGNDLPNWEGGPQQTMVLEHRGNRWIWIAQKEPNVYYVTHGVSG